MKDLSILEASLSQKVSDYKSVLRVDCPLPVEFKKLVPKVDNHSIKYLNYSFIVSGKLDIYLPNQLWYLAAICVPLYKALSLYKGVLHDRTDISSCKGDKTKAEKLVKDLGYDGLEGDLLIRFLSDYDWWRGGKSIERTDYFYSPILSVCNLVNASQSYVAEMCKHLASNEEATSLLNQALIGLHDTLNSNNTPHQIIYFGAPGSGKSHKVKAMLEGVSQENIFRTTFHPDSDYASFVGCYKPTMKEKEIAYDFSPQVFTNAYVRAWEVQSIAKEQQQECPRIYLLIEEINRGNCAQIFGDLFQLLDRDSKGVSEYKIQADEDLTCYLQSKLDISHKGIKDGNLCLPSNLYIIATMNTSDQSLFPMDSAFKRRWDWEYIPINYSREIGSGEFVISIGSKQYHWIDFLEKVNERILEVTDSEDKQMGNFFIKHSVGEAEFKSKVMFYLWHEVCRDEYHTKNNFFRYLSETQGEQEFSFNELYKMGGTELINGFMQYLGVMPMDKSSTYTETRVTSTETTD